MSVRGIKTYCLLLTSHTIRIKSHLERADLHRAGHFSTYCDSHVQSVNLLAWIYVRSKVKVSSGIWKSTNIRRKHIMLLLGKATCLIMTKFTDCNLLQLKKKTTHKRVSTGAQVTWENRRSLHIDGCMGGNTQCEGGIVKSPRLDLLSNSPEEIQNERFKTRFLPPAAD